MKILQINAIGDSESTGRTCREMNDIFWSMGYEATVAYSVGMVKDMQREYKIGTPIGQRLHALLSRITGLQGYFSRNATRKLLRFMGSYKPDAVILRNLHANYIHLPMLLKYLAKKDIATVAVLHDCWFYTGKCCHYTVAGCYRWQEACGNCPAKKNYNVSWFFDRTGKMLRDKKKGFGTIPRLAVVAVSDWLLSEAQKSPVFANAITMKRIYNWIDTKKFIPMDTAALRCKMGLTDKKVILCVASGWDKCKGLDTVINLASRLMPDERLILLGNVNGKMDIPLSVIHIPRTDSVDRLAELYNLADVFVQPSLEETFGKVTAEALACGTPVVCYDSTANPELVGSGCGAVVPVGDLDGMLQKIREIFAVEKKQYEGPCRTFAENNFDMNKNIMQYVKIISTEMAYE